MRFHVLKTLEPHFSAVKDYEKTFELRKNDRDYQVGDIIYLIKYLPDQGLNGGIDRGYSYDAIRAIVRHILKDVPHYGLQDGFCILSLGRVIPLNLGGAARETQELVRTLGLEEEMWASYDT